MNRECGGKRKNGQKCHAPAIKGGTACWRHTPNPKARANAAVRAELQSWGLHQQAVDPGETLLKLMTQAWYRIRDLQVETQRVIDDAPTLRDALIGDAWIGTDDGPRKSGEYLRGLTVLEAQERERCAKWAAMALTAGLNERVVRLAEQQGQLIADVLRAVLADPELALTEAQRRAVPNVGERVLALVG